MSTTIESLRKLGLKVNGTEPTNNNIGNVINEIADDYQGGSGSAGVSSIGGVDGAITLGTGLSMSGQELQVSASGGGTQLYKHTFTVGLQIEGETMPATISAISATGTAITSTATLNAMITDFIAGSAVIDTDIIALIALQNAGGSENIDANLYFAFCSPAGDGVLSGISATIIFASFTDTVTAL